MSNESILIIEDEESLCQILTDILKTEGYEITQAGSGSEAISKSKETSFNLVLSDINLPDGDGLEILGRIKEDNEDICAIIMTGYASVKTAVAAIEKGVYDYLTKPLDMRRLKDVIAKGLERQRLQTENKDLLKRLKYENEKLETILQVEEGASTILNLNELAQFVIDKIGQVIACKRASLMVVEENEYLVIKAARGLSDEIIKNTRIKIGEGISGSVAQSGKPLLVENIETHPTLHRDSDPRYASKSFLSIPLIYQGKVIGIINTIDKISSFNGCPPIFNQSDLMFLSTIANYVAIAIENAKLFEEKSYLAITDHLTRLYNQRYFQEQLETEVKRIKRYPRPLSLIMIDIDHFKNYNDTCGHLMGDTVLKEVANIFKSHIRETDIAARYGGEEFCVILPDTEVDGAVALAEKIREAVEERPFESEQSQPNGRLTISCGVASFQESMKEKDELIKRADEALYAAKHAGRNRVCVHNSGR